MVNIVTEITDLLKSGGASVVGFADMRALPANIRHDLPRAISFAVALDPKIVASIKDGPTMEYYNEYKRANALLGKLGEIAADFLQRKGCRAMTFAATHEGIDFSTNSTILPHKTVATLAGLGWIGKCALLVTEQFGSAIRINRVLTDVPLTAATPIVESRCGECTACVDACPGHAPKGVNWASDKYRDLFFDAGACRDAAREMAYKKVGIKDTFCGICMAVCPWTIKYVKNNLNDQ